MHDTKQTPWCVARLHRAGRSLLPVILLACAAPMASASTFYLGASVGQARTAVDDRDITDRLAASGLSGSGRIADTERTGWKAYAGYQWLEFMALEGGYTSLGEMSLDFSGVGIASAKQLAEIAPVSGDLWELALVGRYPMAEKWHLLTRVGAVRWDMEYSLGSDSGSLTGTDPVLGLSVERHISHHWFARLGWDHYVVPEEDTDLFSLGVVYRFGEPATRRTPVVPMPAAPVRQPAPAPVRAPEPAPAAGAAGSEETEETEGSEEIAEVQAAEQIPEPVQVLAPTAEAPTVASIQFELGSADVPPGGLDEAIAWLKANPQARVDVHGYTDTTGPVEFNRALSQRRAGNVRDALLAGGVDPDQVSIAAHGSAAPRADNETLAGRRLNRRVEVILLP
ncbi:hypothetical protein A167_02336 [Alcanivorax sp. S71-1-4]|uniref:OmpA family protein n=1 Tax=Alcanivorax sp. S71-1-4 TaxID=1177159 RepID=UPI0013569050|nr:OmpA family protein [Alcanivorax sp. S71-1-4]KAF0808869.1 hypothetical protein A167_02336 [Alcanivorax sp. S71-1-4]